MTLNAGGIAEGVFESELFGHVQGRLHRRARGPRRTLRARRRRHALPRRDRQRPGEPAGQAPARARDRGVRAGRLLAHAAVRRAPPLGDQRRPARRGRRGPLPPGPPLPPEHGRDPRARRCASGARTSRCSPSTSCGARRSATARAVAGFEPEALRGAPRPSLAGQRAGARPRRRAGGAHGDAASAIRAGDLGLRSGGDAPRLRTCPSKRSRASSCEGHGPLRRQRQPGGPRARPVPQRPLPAAGEARTRRSEATCLALKTSADPRSADPAARAAGGAAGRGDRPRPPVDWTTSRRRCAGR